ncbi:MAG: stage III sporulation protein AD [Clostridia bacterium]|nr:stage III sporulation protein AD [Clostridia bacterium]
MNIYQLLASVVACLLIYLILKGFNERFAVYVSIAGAILILFYVCTKLASVFGFIQHLANSAGIENQYFEAVIKGLAVCYLGEFTVSACKDCGQSGWSDKVELACRCTLLVLAIPLFEDFLQVILGLLE